MAENYEEIVREWYVKLQPEFLRRLTSRYSGLTLADAENIYQDAFLAVHDNLQQGRVQTDTSWRNYILTIGMNMASKAWRSKWRFDSTDEGFDEADEEDPGKTLRKVDEEVESLQISEENNPLCKNEEALALLGDELIRTPEPCATLIKRFYYGDYSMEEIAEEMGYKNAATAKSKKNQCMKQLIARVTQTLRKAGFECSPKKRNPNGKN